MKTQHRCYVAECFLNPSRPEWLICVRPTKDNSRDLNRSASKYIYLSMEQAVEICATNALSTSLAEKIDAELDSLTGRRA